MKPMIAGFAVILLAAFGPSGDGNKAFAKAAESANAAGGAMHVVTQRSRAKPLPKEQALALMKQRHENFERIGAAMKLIGGELKAEKPALGKVRTGAATIAALAPKVPSWFPAGTGPAVGKTEARDEIWQKPQDFAAKAQAFRKAALAFNAAAKTTDLPSIRAAQASLGKSCKGCHDLYREEN